MVKIIERLTTIIKQKNKNNVKKKETMILQNVLYDVAKININWQRKNKNAAKN